MKQVQAPLQRVHIARSCRLDGHLDDRRRLELQRQKRPAGRRRREGRRLQNRRLESPHCQNVPRRHEFQALQSPAHHQVHFRDGRRHRRPICVDHVHRLTPPDLPRKHPTKRQERFILRVVRQRERRVLCRLLGKGRSWQGRRRHRDHLGDIDDQRRRRRRVTRRDCPKNPLIFVSFVSFVVLSFCFWIPLFVSAHQRRQEPPHAHAGRSPRIRQKPHPHAQHRVTQRQPPAHQRPQRHPRVCMMHRLSYRLSELELVAQPGQHRLMTAIQAPVCLPYRLQDPTHKQRLTATATVTLGQGRPCTVPPLDRHDPLGLGRVRVIPPQCLAQRPGLAPQLSGIHLCKLLNRKRPVERTSVQRE